MGRRLSSSTNASASSKFVRCLVEVGELGAARTHAEQGFHQAEALNHPYSLANAFWGRGFISLRQGDAEAAIRAFERSFALCVEGNYGYIVPVVQSLLGSAYLLAGRVAEALPLLREATAHARPSHTDVAVALNHTIGTEIKKTRPGVVVSNDSCNTHGSRVVVLPATSNIDSLYPGEALIPIKGQPGRARGDQIRSLDRIRLQSRIGFGSLTTEEMAAVDEALLITLGVDR